MDISLILKCYHRRVVSVVGQIFGSYGREAGFLTSLAGLILVLMWIVPYIYELFSTIQRLLNYKLKVRKCVSYRNNGNCCLCLWQFSLSQ